MNAVGGNDELIFDGSSTTLDKNGKVTFQSKPFEEQLLVHDLSEKNHFKIPLAMEMDLLQKALSLTSGLCS